MEKSKSTLRVKTNVRAGHSVTIRPGYTRGIFGPPIVSIPAVQIPAPH